MSSDKGQPKNRPDQLAHEYPINYCKMAKNAQQNKAGPRHFRHKQSLPINIAAMCKIPATASQIVKNNSWSFHEGLQLPSSTIRSSLFPLHCMDVYIAICTVMGVAIGIVSLGRTPACMYLCDGKVLFISLGCTFY